VVQVVQVVQVAVAVEAMIIIVSGDSFRIVRCKTYWKYSIRLYGMRWQRSICSSYMRKRRGSRGRFRRRFRRRSRGR
jgi:hypothetical protein